MSIKIDPAEYDKQWWKTFLEPLNINQNKQGSNTIRLNPQFTDESLVGRFIERLSNHHRIKTEEKEQAVASAKRNFEEKLQLLPCEVRDFEEMWDMWKAYQDAKNIKSHRESSGSTWTVEMLASYVQRQDVEIIQFLVPPCSEELIAEIEERINISNKAIGGQLRTECDTRMVLDAILHPICVYYKGLTIRTEQTFTCDLLPTNKPDYIMYYNNQRIGVVEAKRTGYLIDKSVVQLILQLLSVSAEKPSLPYFGLVSDGIIFILVVVCGKKVRFFQENQSKLELESANWNKIVCSLLWYIEEVIRFRT